MRLQRDAAKRRAPEACRSARKTMRIAAILGMILLVSCGPVMTPNARIISPSRKYMLIALLNEDKADTRHWHCVRLVLLTHSGETLSAVQTGASNIQKWAAGWMENDDIVVLQSSDIGTTAYNVVSNTLTAIQITPEIEDRAIELKKLKYKQ